MRSNLPLASSCNWSVTAASVSGTAVATAGGGVGAGVGAGTAAVEVAVDGVSIVAVVGTSSPPDAACGFGAGASAAGDAGAGGVISAGITVWAADSSGFAVAWSGVALAGAASMLIP